MLYRAIEELHRECSHLLKKSVSREAKVLVAGSGTGKEAVTYALENPGWRVTGFDPAENMVAAAKEKALQAGVEDRVSFIHGGAEDAPQESFDAATSILVKHFVPYDEKRSYLTNIARRLKPGAPFITADITGQRNEPGFKEHLLAWEEFQKEGRDDPEEIEKTIERVRLNLPILSEEETVSLLEETGFTNVRPFWERLMIKGFVAEKD